MEPLLVKVMDVHRIFLGILSRLGLLRISWFRNKYDDIQAHKHIFKEEEYRPVIPPRGIIGFGAHKGIAAEYFAITFPDIPIHVYEASPETFRVLKRRMRRYSNVRFYNEAASQTDGAIEFNIAPRHMASSIYPVPGSVTVHVSAVTLRTAVGRLGVAEGIFLKVDIEGSEYDVLKDIPSQVQEIIGEAHPIKASRSNDELARALTRFAHVEIPNGKGIFHAF